MLGLQTHTQLTASPQQAMKSGLLLPCFADEETESLCLGTPTVDDEGQGQEEARSE